MDKIQTILFALKVSGIGLVVLLLVLAVLALIVSLLTRFIKDTEEEGEETSEENEEIVESVEAAPENDLSKVAAIAVAIARAESQYSSTLESKSSTLSSWGQFYLNRRLNLSSSFRRSK